MMVRVGINGFGSIGRRMLRIARDSSEVEIVHLNDVTKPEESALLLRYDTNYGRYPGEVGVDGDHLVVDGRRIRVTAERDPGDIPWGESGVQVVVESTGRFTDAAEAGRHLRDSVRKVVISAPARHEDLTLVLGVNEDRYDPAAHRIISNASCTTNCLAPVMKVVLDTFGVESGLMTTIHSYTNDQRLLDLPHTDPRRARAAALNLIPTTTGAAKAIGLVLPSLKGRMNGVSVRVPTPTVSLVDVTVRTERPVSVEAANRALAEAARGPLNGILGYTDDPVVSMDFRGDPRSSIVDGTSTMTIGDRLLKVISWYDNEWGYSARLVDVVAFLGRKGL
jgi:glyceraldehyde 3-phosphate dehydrogenase